MEIVVKSFDQPEFSRTMLDGSSRSAVFLRTSIVGLGTYEPGWRWSVHAGPQIGRPSENHIGYVLSGSFGVRDASGVERRVGPGEAFELPPGSDAWVEGEEPCVALDFASLPT
jgi:hypothetical protein